MSDFVHYGKRSWWDGSVTTLCGLKFPKGKNSQQMFTWGEACPKCKAEKKSGRKL